MYVGRACQLKISFAFVFPQPSRCTYCAGTVQASKQCHAACKLAGLGSSGFERVANSNWPGPPCELPQSALRLPARPESCCSRMNRPCSCSGSGQGRLCIWLGTSTNHRDSLTTFKHCVGPCEKHQPGVKPITAALTACRGEVPHALASRFWLQNVIQTAALTMRADASCLGHPLVNHGLSNIACEGKDSASWHWLVHGVDMYRK